MTLTAALVREILEMMRFDRRQRELIFNGDGSFNLEPLFLNICEYFSLEIPQREEFTRQSMEEAVIYCYQYLLAQNRLFDIIDLGGEANRLVHIDNGRFRPNFANRLINIDALPVSAEQTDEQ